MAPAQFWLYSSQAVLPLTTPSDVSLGRDRWTPLVRRSRRAAKRSLLEGSANVLATSRRWQKMAVAKTVLDYDEGNREEWAWEPGEES